MSKKRQEATEATYTYLDAAGQVLFYVERKSGKRFSQCRPDGQGGRIWNLKGVERVLYRLPSVLAAVKEGKVIWVVEGEKDADNLGALGLTVTTNPGGAGKWRKEYSASLKGARIAIVPDNDKAGRDHAWKVAKALQGVASEVKVLIFPDLPEKGDVSDWIDAQRKARRSNDEIRAELECLIAAAPSSEQWLKEGVAPAEAEKADQAEEEDQRSNQSQVLTEIASSAEYFHAPDGTAYATVEINDHKETWPVRSIRFTEWLTRSFFERERKPPGSEPLNGALRLVSSWARWDGEELPIFVRVAKTGEGICLDSGDASWKAIEIDASGWREQTDPKVKFHRSQRIGALPQPVRGGDVNELRRFVNVAGEQDLILIVAWLLGALQPSGPYPILILQGEQGSAKSTAARVLRSLVDPSKPTLRAAPRDERDLMIAANQSWVLVFDNLSRIRDWLSDAFCRLATGGGFATRELYSNGEEVVFEAQRPIILNGIEDLAARQDLADRAIVVNLPAIPEAGRRTERDLWRDFEEAAPRILGSLCDAVSAALRNVSTVKLPAIPRMADFAEWVVAAEAAWPWPAGAFMEAYSSNRAEATEVALENDVVALAARQMLQGRESWEGTPTELQAELEEHADERILQSRAWPKSPRGISAKLKRSAACLRSVGIDVKFYREGGRNSRRIISIREVCVASVASVAEPPLGRARTGSDNATQTAEEATQTAEEATQTAEEATQRPAQPSHSGARKCSAGDAGDAGDAKMQAPLGPGEQEVLWV